MLGWRHVYFGWHVSTKKSDKSQDPAGKKRRSRFKAGFSPQRSSPGYSPRSSHLPDDLRHKLVVAPPPPPLSNRYYVIGLSIFILVAAWAGVRTTLGRKIVREIKVKVEKLVRSPR
jgi:hypothetical protein